MGAAQGGARAITMVVVGDLRRFMNWATPSKTLDVAGGWTCAGVMVSVGGWGLSGRWEGGERGWHWRPVNMCSPSR